MKKFFFLFFICCSLCGWTQADSSFKELPLTLQQNGNIFGTLCLPADGKSFDVVLMIAGSGPTDRNGNNPVMKNDALKKLAHHLAEANIASVRYDKRGIGESKGAATAEAEMRFDSLVSDAKAWVNLLKNDKRFKRIFILGHSEGSLIGMMAAQKADGFISVAGAGQSADKILKEQLSTQPQNIKDTSYAIIDTLVNGLEVKRVHPILYSLFRPSVQPYLISWFRYNPQTEIKQLKIPVLIVQGTADIQVQEKDALLLAASNPKAKVQIIKGMNHVLRTTTSDRKTNIATYSNAALPLNEELVKSITGFIKSK